MNKKMKMKIYLKPDEDRMQMRQHLTRSPSYGPGGGPRAQNLELIN